MTRHRWHPITVPRLNSLSSWEGHILSQMSVETACMRRGLLLYTCGHGSDWNTWFQLFGWMSEYLCNIVSLYFCTWDKEKRRQHQTFGTGWKMYKFCQKSWSFILLQKLRVCRSISALSSMFFLKWRVPAVSSEFSGCETKNKRSNTSSSLCRYLALEM